MLETIINKKNIFLTWGYTAFLILLLAGCSGLSKEMRVTGTVPPELASEIHACSAKVESDIRAQYRIDFDSEEAERVQAIVSRLQEHANRDYMHSRAGIITDVRYVNSCTGGEHVYIGISLLHEFQDEDMLAFILAHEIAHIDRFHTWRTFKGAEKKRWTGFVLSKLISTGAAFVPGGSSISVVSLLAPTAVNMFNSLSLEIIRKGYSKSYEYEADYDAYCLMAKAGYDEDKAVAALERIDELNKRKDWLKALGVFSTHPNTKKRVKHLAKLIEAEKNKKEQI